MPAIGGELLERPVDRELDRDRHRLALNGEAPRLFRQKASDDRLHRRPGERRLSGQHLVGHGPERVDVGPGIDRAFPHCLLGRHVLGGAEAQSRLGHPVAAGVLDREGDPEVGHRGVAVLEEDVLGLDVAMDHAEAVGVAEGVGHFARDLHGVLDRQLLLALQPGAEGLARHQRHHVVEEAVGLAAVEERENVGVLEPGGGPDFREESLAPEGGAQVGMEDLDGDVAVVLEVVGEIDGRHPALAQLALDPVASLEGLGEALGDRHPARLPAVTS